MIYCIFNAALIISAFKNIFGITIFLNAILCIQK